VWLSGFFMLVSFIAIIISIFLLVTIFVVDLFKASDTSQDRTDYSYNFSEHQNYWDADK
jgi:uncharacterized membrane protein YphA (DoxX/SURF4 family)